MKIQIDHSIRAYDGAELVWHRQCQRNIKGETGFNEELYGPWYLVRIFPVKVKL